MPNPTEKDDDVQASGLGDDPSAQALWDAIEAQESGGAAVEEAPGTAATPAEAASAPEPAAPAADSAPEPDPYEGVPKHVRDELFGLREQMQQLTGRVRNAEGHIGGLRTQLQRDMQAAAATATKAGSDAPSQQQINDASKSPAALARLVEDYPEFGAAIKEVIDAQAGEIASLRQALTTHKPQPADDSREQLQQQVVDLKISTKHPDWKKEVVKADFDPWVATQPREVQALRYSNDPEDVIRLLDIRTAHIAAKRAIEQSQDRSTQTRLKNAQRAAGIPAGRSAASIAAKDLDAMQPEELWKHLDVVEGVAK